MAEPPVLLVPGFTGRDLLYWTPTRIRLERAGFESYTMTLPGLGLQPIDRSAELLGQRVEDLRALTGAAQVVLMGHSLGGLIIRHHVQIQNSARHVAACVTLGTPHRGTLVAGLAILRPGARQMLPGSGVLRLMNAAPLNVPWLNVYSLWDPIVVPPRSGYLRGAENIAYGLGGHWSLLTRSGVHRRVIRWLRTRPWEAGRPPPPGRPAPAA